jgi:hypothetical protein
MFDQNFSSEIRKYRWVIFIFLVFHFLDIMSTYFVVCLSDGIEINSLYRDFTYSVGFFPSSILTTLVGVIAISGIILLWKNVKVSDNLKITLIAIVFLSAPIYSVIFNSHTIFSDTNSIEMSLIINGRLPTINEEHNFNHEKFCRIF